jgi:hypothetical protein
MLIPIHHRYLLVSSTMYTQIIYVCLVFYMSATHGTKLIYEHMDLFVIKPLICVKIIVTSVDIESCLSQKD